MTEPNSETEKPKEERMLDSDLLKKGLRCDLDQLKLLKRCSDKKDVSEWNEWRKKHPQKDILLEGANLQCAFLGDVLLNSSLNSGFSGEVCLKRTNPTFTVK